MHRLMGNTVRFILALSALLLSATSLFGQYGTFNADEREIKQYPVYDTYVDIIVEYNNGQTITEVIAELDSLAEKSLKASENLQYLFLKNEIANILSHRSEYVRAYNILKNSTEKFRTRHDTLHMEYYASLRLQRNLLNRIKNSPTHEVTETRSQEELFEAQFALLDTLGKTGEAYRHSLIDYGLMLFRKGKTKKAIESMYKTRYMALEADDLTSLALADYSIITNMPVSYDLLQTQQEVLKADIGLFESRKSSIPVKLYNAYFHTLVSSNYHEHFNNPDSAIVYAEQAINILDSLNYAAYNIKAATYGNLAIYYGKVKDSLQMWESLEKARHLAETQSMSAYNRAFAYHLIAKAALPYSTDSTLRYISVLDSLPGSKHFEDNIKALKTEAYIQSGELKKAKSLIFSVFQDFDGEGAFKIPGISDDVDYSVQISFLSLLERVYTRMSETGDVDLTSAILTIISRQNTLFQKTMLETIYGYETTALSRLYDEFLQRVLPFVFNLDDSIYHKEKTALLLSSKAIQLNSLMAKKRAHAMLENDSSLFSKLVTSTQTIQATRNKLAGANHTNAEVEQLKTELNSHLIENMMLRYRADLKSGKHDLKVFQDNFALASCEKIQDELDTDEAILEYFVLDNGWGQLLILPDTSMCFYTGGDELSAKIKQERYAVMTGNESTDIGQTLLSAVMPYLDNITELLIIPDGELHFIPFECMKTENGMLIERFAVSYVYSASLWYNLRRTSDENKPENLLTIAPVFNENTEAYVSEYWGNRAIGPLPYSREEVMGIESVFQNNVDTVVHLSGRDASEAAVKGMISDFDIVHFASHGIVNEQYPERSGMILYNSDSSQNTKNVHLEIFSLGELFNMNLDAGLLVLSSCYSGKGSIMEGEGIIALPRGAILAGVPRTLASLWNVHDERTKDFMLLFYKHLANGNPYRNALQQAKLDAIEAGFLTKNWAGFVLIGS